MSLRIFSLEEDFFELRGLSLEEDFLERRGADGGGLSSFLGGGDRCGEVDLRGETDLCGETDFPCREQACPCLQRVATCLSCLSILQVIGLGFVTLLMMTGSRKCANFSSNRIHNLVEVPLTI
ncbi:unnamed protein product [Microthlaspi erraticum]|uniref:Uncharacterized protein n=1 Tax=Microthlaspi erraticum TaxID=1685480 RepID=A0A6D2HTJ7_9BRAS|nr:unnamed protein product [Microthlaspi erraticum]